MNNSGRPSVLCSLDRSGEIPFYNPLLLDLADRDFRISIKEESTPMRPKDSLKKERKMDMTLLIMIIFAGVMAFIAYQKGPGTALAGLKSGGKLFWDILPVMVFAFFAAGMIMQVLPRDLLTHWLGEESGPRGLIIATLAGAVTPGGPFVQFPIVAALLKGGAGVAPLMAYVTSWSLLGINRFLVFEMPILGLKLSVSRMVASLIFPIIIGVITRLLFTKV